MHLLDGSTGDGKYRGVRIFSIAGANSSKVAVTQTILSVSLPLRSSPIAVGSGVALLGSDWNSLLSPCSAIRSRWVSKTHCVNLPRPALCCLSEFCYHCCCFWTCTSILQMCVSALWLRALDRESWKKKKRLTLFLQIWALIETFEGWWKLSSCRVVIA